MWIWQQEKWPLFTWDNVKINCILRDVRLKQGVLIGKMQSHSHDVDQRTLDTYLTNILNSSAIEGENLNAFSVRSSLAKSLGMSEEKPFPTTLQTDGYAEIITDAVENLDAPLTLERILNWHKRLFPKGYSLISPIAGGNLRDNKPMQVVSGRIDKPKVHFEAPGRESLEQEISTFLSWFNESRGDTSLDPLLRAAVAHLWFLTIHPLADGNGRIARLLTDLALAQAEQQSIRFYAMSVGIAENRNNYYKILEQTQKGDLVITDWLLWFFKTLDITFNKVLTNIDQTIFKTNFWKKTDQTQLTSEQVKVLNRMLDGDFENGISTSQYHKVAKVSKPTATRHLSFLVEQGCLIKSKAGGRSTRYQLYYY